VAEILQALLLGVVQGLTEFLPVSSSGHLVLVQNLFGTSFVFLEEAVLFDLVLHIGTLVPVMIYYRQELLSLATSVVRDGAEEDRRWVLYVIAATIPTALMGVLLKDRFEALFHAPRAVAGALMVTALLLLATRSLGSSTARRPLSLGIALALGVAQGMAITPGISRSGSTIAVALLLGMSRVEAARFSFIMSIPAILGAMVLTLADGVTVQQEQTLPLVLGFAASAGVGYLALAWLVRLVKDGRLYLFAWYLIPVSVLGFMFL
jgi:undecaprenyl-diphosphatase